MINRLLVPAAMMLLLVLSPVLANPDPTAAATRSAVEATLRSMEAAVLTGDADAYLRHVCGDDSVFLQEQRMWAEDLKRHKPDRFTLRIIDPAERAANEAASKGEAQDASKAPQPADADADFPSEFGPDRAVFELEMSWEITVPLADGEEGEPDHLDRTVSYPVVFERKDDQWLFRGERWIEVRAAENADNEEDDDAGEGNEPAKAGAASTRMNVVLCFPGFEEVAQRIAEVLPAVRAHVDEGFEQEVPHAQVVKIYPTMRHLQASIYLSYVDGLGGWNEPKESIKVLVRPNTQRGSLRTLLAHEYGHVATFELGPKATDTPWWALEGVAELCAEAFRRNGNRGVVERVRVWHKDDKLADFASITDFRNTPRQFMGHVYTQGHHMVGYISDRFGRTKRNNWFRAMANGASIDQATKDVLGLTGGFTQLDEEWRAELGKPEVEAQAN